jgi:carbon-monoxide dehydrogenase small subunit
MGGPLVNKAIRVTVNGQEHERTVEVRATLADFLREDLDLTGTHVGCEHGVCGACTVLLDGEPVRSCLMLAVQADGQRISTIEGVAPADGLHPIQEAFVEHGASQCGICIPGMIMAAKALLEKNPNPTEEEIRRGISGNLCRCTGYIGIITAIDLNSVSSLLLGHIASAIRRTEHFGQRERLTCEVDHTNAHADRKRARLPNKGMFVYRPTQFLRQTQRIVCGTVLQQYAKFITAQSRERIAFA